MEKHHEHLKGIAAIIIASLLWGTTGTAASFSPDVSSLAIGAFSMGIGGLLLVISARKKLLVDYKIMLKQPYVLFLGTVCVAIYPLAFYTSMSLSGVAIGTVVSIATAPFFAAIIERTICKKHISLQWILSFVIGAIGIVLLTLGRDESDNTAYSINQQGLGIILACTAGLTYAGYSWVAKRLIESGVHSKSSMSGLFGCAALLLIPSLWFTGGNIFSSSTSALVSLYMAIIPIFLGYLLFAFGLNYTEASEATLITLIEPLVATILAVVIIGEKFKVIGWIGVALVSLCLLIQTIKPQHQLRLTTKST